MTTAESTSRRAALPFKPLLFWFTLLPALLLLFLHFIGADQSIAIKLYQPTSVLAAWILHYSPRITWTVGILLILLVLVARVAGKREIHRQLLGLTLRWLLLGAIALGILSEGLGKQFFDRPRPRETVALGGINDYQPMLVAGQDFNGRSQVSSHAVAAVLVAGLFFLLAPLQRMLAGLALTIGLLLTAVVAYGRLLSGAHFLSDLVLSLWLTMNAGLLMVWLIPRLGSAGKTVAMGLALALLALVIGRPLAEKLELWRQFDQQWQMAGAAAHRQRSIGDIYDLQLRLNTQGWLLALVESGKDGAYDDTDKAESGTDSIGPAGLEKAISKLREGDHFRLALIEKNPFDLTMYGRIKVLCELARVVEQAAFERETVKVELYTAIAGERGPCPGSPVAFLDSPKRHEQVATEILFSGWAFDPGNEVIRVEWLLDGNPVGQLDQQILRPGVGGYFGETRMQDGGRIGFYQQWSTAGLPEGWHRVALKTTNAYGKWSISPEQRIRIANTNALGNGHD